MTTSGKQPEHRTYSMNLSACWIGIGLASRVNEMSVDTYLIAATLRQSQPFLSYGLIHAMPSSREATAIDRMSGDKETKRLLQTASTEAFLRDSAKIISSFSEAITRRRTTRAGIWQTCEQCSRLK
jgi:hypothetical protein